MGDAIRSTGIKLDGHLAAGDIVTVKIKERKKKQNAGPGVFGGLMSMDKTDEALNPQHYRMNGIFKIIAVNGGQAVIEHLSTYDKGRREVWPLALHEWYEASELFAALEEVSEEKS